MLRILILSTVTLAMLGGCATYYRVTDPASGKRYYTNAKPPVVHHQSGTIRFLDAKSGAEVTLTSSEVKTITPAEYETAIGKK